MSEQSAEVGEPLAPREEPPPAATLTVRREWGDLVVGAGLLVIATWFYVTAGGLEDYSGEGIGAADFPRGISILLAIGAIGLIAGAIRRLASTQEQHLVLIRRYRHVALGMVLFIAFPALMQTFGYYLAMAPWLAAFLVLAGERRPLHVAAYVVGFLVFTKVVFGIILGTPLP
jgi:hypothetical protein